jgi:phosphatidylserine/phosphatidylglycerophosphate/cardiolipin synthase-like enzyme
MSPWRRLVGPLLSVALASCAGEIAGEPLMDATRDARARDVSTADNAAQPDATTREDSAASVDASELDAIDPPMDSGVVVPVMDSGVVVPVMDSGVVVPPMDSGVIVDTGVPPRDTGVPPVDTGIPMQPRFSAVFSTRVASSAQSTAVEDTIVTLIRQAMPGSRIRIAIFNFSRNNVSAELVAAFRRGVDVRIVLDGGTPSDPGTEVPALRAGLGADRVTVCDAPGTSCIGSGIMHHKTFLFSQLSDGSRNVVVQASHNLTTSQLTMHNNAVIVRGDDALFAGYESVWEDLRRDVENPNYYRIIDGMFDTRAYFFPRASGDTVVSILDNASCDATSRIRVAMAFFTDARIAIAQALARRAREGCSVSVVIGNGEIPAGSSVLSTLRAAGVVVTLYPTRTNGWGLHSKYLLIDAPYTGMRRQLVFTGSHNWTGPALDTNDESLLKLEDATLFNTYLNDWNHVRNAAAMP